MSNVTGYIILPVAPITKARNLPVDKTTLTALGATRGLMKIE